MNNLYETLEVCLNDVEQGADVDTVLFRYPDLADELRPILVASVGAKAMAVPAPSQDVVRRNRAKLLQYAAKMREGKVKPQTSRIWSVPLRRALVTLMVVTVLFVSGTGLVRAASTTLPGDNLYSVKRTWEDVLLFFTFDSHKRETLELEHENERLEELHELFAEGRSAQVDFAGYLTRQNGNEWRVSGITVFISAETRLPDGQVVIGAAVRVQGQTLGDGVVHAEQIKLLPAYIILPEVQDTELEVEQEKTEAPTQQNEENSGKGSETETPVVKATKTPTPKLNPKTESFEGVVSSIKNNIVVVNGISMDISRAKEVKGTPKVGVVANGEGYYDVKHEFIVVKIEFGNETLNNGSGSTNSNDDKSGGDDNSNDDKSDDDDNSNDD